MLLPDAAAADDTLFLAPIFSCRRQMLMRFHFLDIFADVMFRCFRFFRAADFRAMLLKI